MQEWAEFRGEWALILIHMNAVIHHFDLKALNMAR